MSDAHHLPLGNAYTENGVTRYEGSCRTKGCIWTVSLPTMALLTDAMGEHERLPVEHPLKTELMNRIRLLLAPFDFAQVTDIAVEINVRVAATQQTPIRINLTSDKDT